MIYYPIPVYRQGFFCLFPSDFELQNTEQHEMFYYTYAFRIEYKYSK